MRILALLILCAPVASAHDAHGRSSAPPESRRLRNIVGRSDAVLAAAKDRYAQHCASCHGDDGKARTKVAATMQTRPTDLTNHLMESMKEGEIYWVITNGVEKGMPAFGKQISEGQRWELVHYVRSLREKQRAIEKAKLGPYEWQLPPGFPFPNVPADNPMTAEKVALGRYLFYDKRLSLNQTQSCASCHKQDRAFADERGRGLGSTGELHPRGPMSIANSAYVPALTWVNPLVRTLEAQALAPMFGDKPIELGMTGKEDVLVDRLKADARYRKMFAAAFPKEAEPFSVKTITQAIASFERTVFSGDSPYDRYRLGDDVNAISESAKRGEALFFSERLECFHCHGGFNFSGTVDYLDKGFAEVEFHNTGLYNLKDKFNYPSPNLGLYEFTQQLDDVGKFRAPTLRNIALTAPYMHDGSIATLEEAIDHYAAGGRTIADGPRAGIGFKNPNKSEFVKGFQLSVQEKTDLIAFLRSLTDEWLVNNPAFSDPFAKSNLRFTLRGEVVNVFADNGAVQLYHEEVPGLMRASKAPHAMDFLVQNRTQLKLLRIGQTVRANVRLKGKDYVLEDLRTVSGQSRSARN